MHSRLFLLVVPVLLALAGPACARGGDTLDSILPEIRAQHPGRLSDAEPFTAPDGSTHYRIKWMTPEGRILYFDADTRSGRFSNSGGGGRGREWGGGGRDDDGASDDDRDGRRRNHWNGGGSDNGGGWRDRGDDGRGRRGGGDWGGQRGGRGDGDGRRGSGDNGGGRHHHGRDN